MKRCTSCQEWKEKSEFSPRKGKCKKCSNELRREYHWKNRDKDNSRSKSYYESTKEERKDKISQYAKVYYIKNKEKINMRGKNYRDTHPETRRKHVWNRRSRLRSAKGNGISESQWRDLLEKYENKCLCCGRKDNIQLDHIVPLSRGGYHDISNAQPLCGKCNNEKGTKTIDYRSY